MGDLVERINPESLKLLADVLETRGRNNSLHDIYRAANVCRRLAELTENARIAIDAGEEIIRTIAGERDEATARLATIEHETRWQPIETAPTDGRMALVYRPLARESGDEPVAIKRLIGGHNHCWNCTVPEGQKPTNPTNGSCHVTHWMDFPTPPSSLSSPHGKGE
jgi:hypothetical protein